MADLLLRAASVSAQKFGQCFVIWQASREILLKLLRQWPSRRAFHTCDRGRIAKRARTRLERGDGADEGSVCGRALEGVFASS